MRVLGTWGWGYDLCYCIIQKPRKDSHTLARSLIRTKNPCILTSLTDSFTASKASLLTSSFKSFSLTYLLMLLSDKPLEMWGYCCFKYEEIWLYVFPATRRLFTRSAGIDSIATQPGIVFLLRLTIEFTLITTMIATLARHVVRLFAPDGLTIQSH